ncbi:MAG: phosphoribosylformylglycinamidine synthase, partial [Gammaproteobacteria bacterium]|nr:phosphoribosylformylglycinamidine synthase [Gammaproteobacteria bacterium]
MASVKAYGVRKISSHYIHLIKTSAELSDEERSVLNNLLEYGPQMREVEVDGPSLYVFPRVGTISPWSSKATDIAHICGLDKVIRIERGIEYQLEFSASSEDLDLSAIEASLHDKMVEQVFSSLDNCAALFEHHNPQPLTTVDILQGGKAELVTANSELGLALSDDEIDYLVESYQQLARNPTD